MERTTSLGYWLRHSRKALDLTQAELTQRAGCSLALIRKIEADTRRPSRRTNLLAQLTPLVGREREAAAIGALLRRPGLRALCGAIRQ